MTTFARRSFLGLAAAGIAASAAACTPGGGTDPTTPAATGGATSPAGGGSPAPAGDAALKVSWYGGAPVHTAMEAALQGFSSANPTITTTGTGVGFGDYWDKLATETSGGAGPDVFRMSMTYFTEYATRGALHDLTPQVGSVIDLAGLDDDVRDSGLIDGAMMGVGQSSIAPALFSHSGLLAKVGATLPTEWTWDEFATWCVDYAKQAGSGQYAASDLGGNFQMFDVYARQHVGNQFADDGSLKLTKEVVESWFALWDGLRKQNAAPPQDITTAATNFETNPMSKGIAAVTAGWVQQVTFFQPLVGDATVNVSALPQKTKGDFSGQFVKALDFWCVSKTTKYPEQAARLVDHLVNDPSATKEIGLLLGVPPTAAARGQLSESDAPAQAAVAFVEEITPKAGKAPGPWPKGYGECLSAFTRAGETVGFGQATPGEAADAFLGEAKAALGA